MDVPRSISLGARLRTRQLQFNDGALFQVEGMVTERCLLR
jgi:hypothetical protein